MKFKISVIILIGAYTFASADSSFMKICKNPTLSELNTLKAIYIPITYGKKIKVSDCSGMYKFLQTQNSVLLSGNDVEDIDNISILQYFPNLQKVTFSENMIKDLSPLAKMTNLKTLDLGKSEAIDLSPLSSLKKLETLSFSNDNIADLSVLGQIKSLKSLRIYSNSIKDITPLSNLTNLEDLLISSRSISNICPLNKLTKLKILNMGLSERVNDISCLKDLKQLEELDITYTKVKKIDVVKNYKNLNSFSGNSSVEDMSPLVGLQKLEYATIHSMNLMECSPSRIEEVRAGKHCTKEDYVNLNKPWWKKVLGL